MKLRLPLVLAFVAFALCFLLGPLQPYLRETGALTPFYADEFTFSKLLGEPCGLLFQVAAGMQSCFARPWLGAILFTAVLVAVAYVQRWAFRISDAWFGLCWVAPFALLTNYTQLGYLIYTLKHPAVAFTPALGMLAAIALMGLWLRLKSWWWNVAFVLLVPIVGFWLLGAYGLLVLPLLGFCEAGVARWGLREDSSISFKTSSMFSEAGVERLGLREKLTRHSRGYHMLWGLAFFALGFLLPLLFRAVLQQPLDFETGWLSFSNAESQLRLPAIFTVVPLTIFLFFRLSGNRLWQLIAAAVVFIAAGAASYHYSFLDHNFINTLWMKHSAEDGAWEQVLQIAREGKQEPTRAQVCLTRLALFKTGRMGDELFKYPEGAAAYKAPQNQWLRLMIGPLLYYHYGKTGFAYRWAMEDMVEYGERPAYLRYLHSVAQLNSEEALAQRYERALARTLFYKSSVAHFCASKASKESEFSSIRPLLNYTDQLDGDDGLVEFYLLNSFALSEGGSREMVELSLMDGLITKNLSGFWPRFMALLPTWQGRIPTHYQEAALMVAQLQGGAPVSDIPFDPAIQQRFQQLIAASARMGDNAANAVALRPEFGDTYWYYYFFVDGLKTN